MLINKQMTKNFKKFFINCLISSRINHFFIALNISKTSYININLNMKDGVKDNWYEFYINIISFTQNICSCIIPV